MSTREPSAPPPRSTDRGSDPVRARAADELWTVAELLEWTQGRFARAGIDSPRVDAEYLLADAMGCDRMALYVRHADVVDPPAKAAFRDAVRRRLTREPVAYIRGRRGFHALDLELHVDPRVLIPRPETEHLVDWLLEELRPPPAPPTAVVDVGTGSGAIALAIKHARPDVDVTGVDVSSAAVDVARENATRLGIAAQFAVSDLLPSAAPSPWHAIAANLPYIPTQAFDALAPEIVGFEPRAALDGGPDGLDFVRRLIAAAPQSLAPHGAMYLEVGHDQTDATRALLADAGFIDIAIRRDYADQPRVVRGFRSG